MTKNEFLEKLRFELKRNSVSDIEEIMSDFEEHFALKYDEGKTEEEIVARLGSPEGIASEYGKTDVKINKFEKGAKLTLVSLMSVPLTLIYILMWSAFVVVGVFAIACLVLGFCLITTINIAGLIPFVPYFSSLLLGISTLGLSLLSAVGTVYIFLYVRQWGKVYLRWSKNYVNNSHLPSLSKQPQLSKKTTYRLKILSMIGLVTFVAAFVAGYLAMCLSAGSFEPWHIWNWFI